MLLEAISGQFADWWWLIAMAAAVFVLRALTPPEAFSPSPEKALFGKNRTTAAPRNFAEISRRPSPPLATG